MKEQDAKAYVLTFGKHKGKTLGWVADHDLLYIDWLTDVDPRSPIVSNVKRFKEAVKEVARLYADAIEEKVEARDEQRERREEEELNKERKGEN